MKQICKNCEFFGKICRRFWTDFVVDKTYYCVKNDKFVEKDYGCCDWQPENGFDFSKQRFEAAEEDIVVISAYLSGNKS